jgi:hypothetical protein
MYTTISVEDQRKLHAEANQILNQRFLLTSSAITVFGAFSAFMIPKPPLQAPAQSEHVLIGGTIYLLVFYSLLFAWNRMLVSLQQVISVYLELKGQSQWEADFRNFIKIRHVGHRVQGWVFLVLGLLSVSWPIVISMSLGLKIDVAWAGALAIVASAYFMMIGVEAFKTRNNEGIRRTWERVLETVPAAGKPLANDADSHASA